MSGDVVEKRYSNILFIIIKRRIRRNIASMLLPWSNNARHWHWASNFLCHSTWVIVNNLKVIDARKSWYPQSFHKHLQLFCFVRWEEIAPLNSGSFSFPFALFTSSHFRSSASRSEVRDTKNYGTITWQLAFVTISVDCQQYKHACKKIHSRPSGPFIKRGGGAIATVCTPLATGLTSRIGPGLIVNGRLWLLIIARLFR